MPNLKKAYRGSIFFFKDSARFETVPRSKEEDLGQNQHQYVYLEDGLLIVENGKVAAVGDYADLKNQVLDLPVTDYQGKLITAGFIDTHLHATQTGVVAAYGEQLLEWLNNYVFPTESIYKDPEAARKDLHFFLDQLMKNGITTAVAYGPLFYDAADVFFEELTRRKLRFITGNTMMDSNAPDYLKLPTQENYDIAQKLIHKWHNKERISFCITPRFSLSCSESLMEMSGSLKKAYPDAYLQTHLDENLAEIEAVQKHFPWSKSYLDVYDHFGLVTDRSVFGHCIHLKKSELELMKERNGIIASCPTSNNFLGSGLFNWAQTAKYTTNITFGSDWSAGNSLSMFRILDDAYKVSMLTGHKLPSMLRLYLSTLGSARALHLDDKIGNLAVGKEADFIVIDPNATDVLRYRNAQVNDIFELLFIIMSLADERNIHATYILGEPAYINPS